MEAYRRQRRETQRLKGDFIVLTGDTVVNKINVVSDLTDFILLMVTQISKQEMQYYEWYYRRRPKCYGNTKKGHWEKIREVSSKAVMSTRWVGPTEAGLVWLVFQEAGLHMCSSETWDYGVFEDWKKFSLSWNVQWRVGKGRCWVMMLWQQAGLW